MTTTHRPSIRDLIAELADTEDVLRGCRTTGARERSARRRQGELVTELRRRHGAGTATGRPAETGRAGCGS